MSNYARKAKRKKMSKVPHCCGERMDYKEGYDIYVCQVCGKEKKYEVAE